jgi:hypothetical protein
MEAISNTLEAAFILRQSLLKIDAGADSRRRAARWDISPETEGSVPGGKVTQNLDNCRLEVTFRLTCSLTPSCYAARHLRAI